MRFRLLFCVVLMGLAGCARQRTSVAVDAALLTEVPPDTVALGAMRVKAMRDTVAWKKMLAQPGLNAQMDKLAAETSFDPRKDLWEILWSTDGKDPLVFARGEFAPMGLEPKIEKKGVQRMNYKGSMLLGDEQNAVWFVNSSTGIFGRTERLRQLIDSRDKGHAGPSPELRRRMEAIPPAAHMWMVADAAALPKLAEPKGTPAGGAAMNFLQNLPKLMQSVQAVTAFVSLEDGVAMEMTADCSNEAGARQVHDSLRGIAGLARIALPEKQRAVFLPLLDSVEVVQKQNAATMRARLTVAQFETLHAALSSGNGPGKPAD